MLCRAVAQSIERRSATPPPDRDVRRTRRKMKALIPTGNPNDMVRFADVAEPVPRTIDDVVTVEAFSINRGERRILGKAILTIQ
jgi:hypothetical protein